MPTYDIRVSRYLRNYLEVMATVKRTTISDAIRSVTGLQPRGLRPGVRKGYLRGIEGSKGNGCGGDM